MLQATFRGALIIISLVFFAVKWNSSWNTFQDCVGGIGVKKIIFLFFTLFFNKKFQSWVGGWKVETMGESMSEGEWKCFLMWKIFSHFLLSPLLSLAAVNFLQCLNLVRADDGTPGKCFFYFSHYNDKLLSAFYHWRGLMVTWEPSFALIFSKQTSLWKTWA